MLECVVCKIRMDIEILHIQIVNRMEYPLINSSHLVQV